MIHLFAIIDQLYAIGSIKLGSFKLKDGSVSPFYVDLRLVVSYPDLLETLADALWQKIAHIKSDHICGVPYSALPITTCLSIKHRIPMLLKRKEKKDYGTKQLIEGKYQSGESCLIIEDVITSGQSVVETSESLQSLGLTITGAAMIIDREQGGKLALEKQGIPVFALMTISDVFTHLKHKGKLTQQDLDKMKKFIDHHQVHLL